MTLKVPARAGAIRGAVLGLVALNRDVLRNSQLPPLYRSGVRYQAEELGSERWLTADEVFAKGRGDCEDLAAWRVAELQLAGELDASVDIARTGNRRFHARVLRANGAIEDPSRILSR